MQDESGYRFGGRWEVAPRWLFGVTRACPVKVAASKSGHEGQPLRAKRLLTSG